MATQRGLLIRLREEQFPSQEAAAERFGVSRSFWGALERGDRNPTIGLASKVALHFGRTIEELFFAPECHDLRHTENQEDLRHTENQEEAGEEWLAQQNR